MSALVLILDADAKRLESTQRLVERAGAATITAPDTRAAMLLFVRREPHLAVLQLESSRGPGLELCRDMKALKTARGRRVIVVGPREARSAAFESGCDAF